MTDSSTPPSPPPPTEDDAAAENEGGGREGKEDEEKVDVAMPEAPAVAQTAAAAPSATVAAVAVAAPAQTAGGKRSPSDFLKTVLGRSVVVKLNSGIDYRGELSYGPVKGLDICWELVREVAWPFRMLRVLGRLKYKASRPLLLRVLLLCCLLYYSVACGLLGLVWAVSRDPSLVVSIRLSYMSYLHSVVLYYYCCCLCLVFWCVRNVPLCIIGRCKDVMTRGLITTPSTTIR